MTSVLIETDKPQASPTRLPTYICVGWGVGAITTALMSNVFNLLVLRFATDYLGIAAGVAALMVAASKLYDGFADPLVGALSDNWPSKRGRRRPFLLLASLVCPLAIISLFYVPDLTGGALLAYYFCALILFNTAFSLWTVPYIAMSAEMTDDYHDRSRLISFRVNGGAVGLLLGSICGPWLLLYLGGGEAGHKGMVLVIGALILVAGLTCHRMTRSAPFTLKTASPKTPLAEQFKLVLSNRPLTLLLGQKAFWYFGFAANQAALAFFIQYVAGLSDFWLGVYYIILPFGMMASQPAWLWLSRRVEKKYASILAMGMFGALQLSWLLSGPDESRYVIFARLILIGFSAGGAMLLIQSMFTDTIEYDFKRTGRRREGAFTGFFSLVEQGFLALGVAAFGGYIGAMGYISARGDAAVEQPASALFAISIGFAVVPFFTALASIAVISFYDLTRQKLADS